MAACVEIWEANAEKRHYHPTGLHRARPSAQEPDLVAVYERQERIGYPSELSSQDAVFEHMRGVYPDWRARGLTVCLHERAGGYAFNRESMQAGRHGPRGRAPRSTGGVEVTGFELDGSDAVTTVHTTEATSPSSRSSSPSARGSPRCGTC